ncbi:hypothetical protein ACVXHA_28765 [Escherichia coli]
MPTDPAVCRDWRVLMLFIIGLEPRSAKAMEAACGVFGGGALQMVICGGLLGLFCMFLGCAGSAELIGMTLALSSRRLPCRR